MRRLILIVSLAIVSSSWGSGRSIEDLKMDKRFGIGVTAAGPLAIMGVEVDINITEQFSMSGGVGTGNDYSTLDIKARYYLPGKSVSPYIGAGLAHWWSSGTKSASPGPGIIQKFLAETPDPSQGFSLFIVYPTLGVQFLHSTGFEVSAEVEYLIKLFDLASGPYAGVGVHWYF